MIFLRDVYGATYYINPETISYIKKEDAKTENIAGYDGELSSLKLVTNEKLFFPHALAILFDIVKDVKVALDDSQLNLVKVIGERPKTLPEIAAQIGIEEHVLVEAIHELDQLQPRLITEDYNRNDAKYMILSAAGKLFAEGKLLYVSKPVINAG